MIISFYLTASLSPATLPHVLGLEHVSQVWHTLEHRFNSISKSQIHELRSRLYSVTKTGTMDSYIDEIRNYVQRLEAVGYHVEGSDMVFCAIKGLPPVFRGIKSAINTIRGDILFDELATILRNEEAQIHKDEGEIGTSTSKVLLTTQKSSSLVPSSQSHDHEASGSGSQMLQAGFPGPLLGSPMYQTPNSAGPYYPQQNFQQSNRGMSFNGGFNQGRGGQGSGFGANTRTECQICGKTNHTDFYCHHRQNLQYQPPSFVVSGPRRSVHQSWQGNGAYQSWNGGNNPVNTLPQSWNSGNNMMFSRPFSGPTAGYQGSYAPQANMSTFNSGVHSAFYTSYPSSQEFVSSSTPSGFTGYFAQIGHNGQFGHRGYGPAFSPPSQSSSNWYFDSGASTHVTHDLANLSQSQPCHTGDGVLVGNGNSLPIAHSGQANTQNSSQGALCARFVPHQELL